MAKKAVKHKSAKRRPVKKRQTKKAPVKRRKATRRPTSPALPQRPTANLPILVTVLIIFIAGAASISYFFGDDLSGPEQKEEGFFSPYGTAKLELYVMSQCPYGTKMENALQPILDRLDDSLWLEINYISTLTEDGFRSLHGEPETQGNIIQLCAQKYHPDDYLDLIVCMNEDVDAIPGNWLGCAQGLGMDDDVLSSCLAGKEGLSLLGDSVAKAEEARARGSPTLYIDGFPYRGRRDETSLLRAICAILDNHPACDDIPVCGSDEDCVDQPSMIGSCVNPNAQEASCEYTEPVHFEVIVLTSKDCRSCDTSLVVSTNEQLFKGVTHRYVDSGSAEGRALIQSNDFKLLPIYLFPRTVEQTQAWIEHPRIRSAFEGAVTMFRLTDESTRARYLIDDAERSAFLDVISVVLGDNRPKTDIFVMSQCPFSDESLEQFQEVFTILKDDVDFVPHYITFKQFRGGGEQYCYDKESQYCSIHGVEEIHENLQGMCIFKDHGFERWLDFSMAMDESCSSSDDSACWEDVVSGMGLSPATISDCVEKSGMAYLEEDRGFLDRLTITGSPSFVVDGDFYWGARSPDRFKDFICESFENPPAGCDVQLATGALIDHKGRPVTSVCGY